MFISLKNHKAELERAEKKLRETMEERFEGVRKNQDLGL